MKRRGFIQTLSATLGALVAPRGVAALSCEAAPVATAPVAIATIKTVINPAYLTAQYQDFFLYNPETLKHLIPREVMDDPFPSFTSRPPVPQGFVEIVDDCAPRWNLVNGEWVQAHPYIQLLE